MFLRTQQGFTMTELIIVVAIIGILGAVGILAINSQMPKYRFNGAVDQVAWDLLRARRDAIKEQRRSQVFFTSDHTYSICYDANGDGSVTLSPCEGSGVSKDIQTNYYGVTFSSTGNPVFLPRGMVQHILSDIVVTVPSPSPSSFPDKTVTIARITGRITVD